MKSVTIKSNCKPLSNGAITMKSGIYFMTFTIIIGIFSLNAVPASVVTDGLVSYWTFDKVHVINDTVKDVWGDNNGTILGNPKVVAGKVGNALEFDGINDYVKLTTLGNFGERVGTSTFEAWIRTSNKEEGMTLFKVLDPDCNMGWGIDLNLAGDIENLKLDDGLFLFHIRHKNDSGGCSASSSGRGLPVVNVTDGKWHHIVYSLDLHRDDKQQRWKKFKSVYIDSKYVGFGFGLSAERSIYIPFKEPIYLGVGKYDGQLKWYFKGAIDEVRIYDRPLSEDEVILNFESKGDFKVEPIDKLSTVWGTLKTKL